MVARAAGDQGDTFDVRGAGLWRQGTGALRERTRAATTCREVGGCDFFFSREFTAERRPLRIQGVVDAGRTMEQGARLTMSGSIAESAAHIPRPGPFIMDLIREPRSGM